MKGKNQKPHIGIFGRRNYGKSSLINILTGQNTAIVSEKAGTTTDPVKKSVEIVGIGATVIIDTAGIDDTGTVGMLRVEKTLAVLEQIDLAVLILVDNVFGNPEEQLITRFREYEIPYVVVHNKADKVPLHTDFSAFFYEKYGVGILDISTKERQGIDKLFERLVKTLSGTNHTKKSLLAGVVKAKDIVLLVTPIDKQAPEGRMILPQVMMWRDLLDNNCICISVKDTELFDFLSLGIRPSLVITDSQAFNYVSNVLPIDIPLTSFSIVLAHQKGNFSDYVKGAKVIETLKNGDKILILESCTHQVSCEDIGSVKIPQWLERFTQKSLHFEIVSGFDKIKNKSSEYALVIQCGGCVVTKKQLQNRLLPFLKAGIPVTNYGLAISVVNGIFDRVIAPFEQ